MCVAYTADQKPDCFEKLKLLYLLEKKKSITTKPIYSRIRIVGLILSTERKMGWHVDCCKRLSLAQRFNFNN